MKNGNENLCIAIPTYNRAEKLDENLKKIIPIVSRYNMYIVISDNCSQDETFDVVKKFQTRYEYILYYRNEENVGFTLNYANVLKLSKKLHVRYIWTLGDDDCLIKEGVDVLYPILQKHYDLQFVNVNGKTGSRMPDIRTCILENGNDVMKLLGGQLTWISSLIFSRHYISEKFLNEIITSNNPFPHTLAIFKTIEPMCKVLWLDAMCVSTLPNVTSSYSEKYLEYFLIDWYEIIRDSGYKYDCEAKTKFLNSTPVRIKSFFVFRLLGIYDFKLYKKVKPFFGFYKLNKEYNIASVVALLFPVCFLQAIRNIYRIFKSCRR